jgi:hypothetical protein
MSPSERQVYGRRAAGRHLRLLLLRAGPYRDDWEHHAHDVQPDDIRQEAVCQVIAQHLYEIGEREETDATVARVLKDRVSRAFGGKGLSLETLRWFEEAFHLSPHDAQRLRELHRGDLHPLVIVGGLSPPVGGPMPRHETTLLFEHHFVGRDGRPVRHHTQQTLRSLVDRMENYQYRFDTPEVEVRVRRGGHAGDVYPIAEHLWAVDIAFHHALSYGEEVYLDYWAICNYREPPPPELRRAAHLKVEHLDMRVEFHPEKLPRHLWWAEWEDYRAPHEAFVVRDEVSLDEEHSVHRYLESIEQAVVGFYWSW